MGLAITTMRLGGVWPRGGWWFRMAGRVVLGG